MDIVGPLLKSRSGKPYMPVVCDYATHYPEAVPLCSTDTEHTAEELVHVFLPHRDTRRNINRPRGDF